jgi:hypothetical protein
MKVKRVTLGDGLAGRSKDGKTVYVDTSVPEWMIQGIMQHENVEARYIAQGDTYKTAHKNATEAEKKFVESKGISWDKYNSTYLKLLREIENRDPKPTDPTDMFMGEKVAKDFDSSDVHVQGPLQIDGKINMSIQTCSIDGKSGWQYGKSGKCYTHDGSDSGSLRAKKKAIARAIAIGNGSMPIEKGMEPTVTKLSEIWKEVRELAKGGPGSGKYVHRKRGVHQRPKNTVTDLRTAKAKAQLADWKESQEKKVAEKRKKLEEKTAAKAKANEEKMKTRADQAKARLSQWKSKEQERQKTKPTESKSEPKPKLKTPPTSDQVIHDIDNNIKIARQEYDKAADKHGALINSNAPEHEIEAALKNKKRWRAAIKDLEQGKRKAENAKHEQEAKSKTSIPEPKPETKPEVKTHTSNINVKVNKSNITYTNGKSSLTDVTTISRALEDGPIYIPKKHTSDPTLVNVLNGIILTDDSILKGGPGSGKYQHKKRGIHSKPKLTATTSRESAAKAKMQQWKQTQEKKIAAKQQKIKEKKAARDKAANEKLDIRTARAKATMADWKEAQEKKIDAKQQKIKEKHIEMPDKTPTIKHINDAKSHEEINKFMKDKYPHMDVDLSKLDVDTARSIAKQHIILANNYPEVGKFVSAIGTFNDPKSNTLGLAFKDGTIAVNVHHFNNKEQLKKDFKESENVNWHPSGTNNVEGVYTHEFGHQVLNYIESGENTHNKAFLPVIAADGIGEIRSTTRLFLDNVKPRNLSTYAKTNEREAFAEGFAAIHHTPDNKQPSYVKRQQYLLSLVLDKSKYIDVKDTKTYRHLSTDEKETASKTINDIRRYIGVKV